MAKVSGPLLSQSASGSIASQLTYQMRNNNAILKKHCEPSGTVSLKQWQQRHLVAMVTAQWQCMTAAEKLVYNEAADNSGEGITGFNLWIRTALADLLTYHGLVCYLPLDNIDGDYVRDISGNGNDFYLYNPNPLYKFSVIDAQSEKYGKALNFINEQTYAYKSINSNPILSWTISFWKQETQYKNYSNIIRNKTITTGSIIFHSDTTYTSVRINTTPTNFETAQYAHNNKKGWVYIVGTSNGTTLKIYCNAVLKDQIEITQTQLNTVDMCLSINSAGYYYSGGLDNIKIYNREFSTNEIWKQYNILRMNKQRS